MKYKTEIEINLPLDKTISIFNNPENMKSWMRGLESFELIEGEEGKAGAKTKLFFNNKGRKTEITETINEINLPYKMHSTYKAGKVVNHQFNSFKSIDKNKTLWISENIFKFSGIRKIMNLIKPMFKKQTLSFMKDFKDFAESKK